MTEGKRMSSLVKYIRGRLRHLDPVIMFCVLALSFIGILTHWGAREVYGISRVWVQSFATVLGLSLALMIATLDYQDICDKLAVPLFIGGVAALLLTLVIGSTGMFGGKSWIQIPGIPLTIQPSEFVKLFLIITFAKHLEVLRQRLNHPLSVLRLALHVGVLAGLVFLQDDLGTAIVYMVVALAMLFAAGLSLWYYIIGGGLIVVAFPYIWPLLGEYQRMRILVGFNPDLDPTDYGMQAIMSRRAITAGGLFGTGLSGGGYYEDVPMANNDFILSMIGEKMGFVGCAIVVLLFAVLIIRIFIVALHARKDCGAYIAVGCAAVLLAQVTENVGMALAILPVVGITLPFLSYGGSSVLSLYLMIGVVQSICTHAKKYHFEREDV